MNNETKEILEKIKDREETYKFCKQYKLAINDWIYEAHYLLDYITNLQQLEQEHQRINGELRERIAYLERSNDRREDTILGLRQEVYEQEDYKSRCEKASEKLGNYKHYTIPTEEQNSENEDIVDSALNILQNGSEKDG